MLAGLRRLSRTVGIPLFLVLLPLLNASCLATTARVEPRQTPSLETGATTIPAPSVTASETAAPAATASDSTAPSQTVTDSPAGTVTEPPSPTTLPSPHSTNGPETAVTSTPVPMMRIPILMYHYVSLPPPDSDAVRLDLSVPPDAFRAEMAHLTAKGFHTIHLADLVQSFKTGETLPPKPIIITFDDGYEDNYANAFPALNEFGFAATFFIITGRADGNSAGYMSWQQIQELAAAGMEIGNHSVDHMYNLGQVSRTVQWSEIKPAFDDLARHLPTQIPVFAYPSGSYNATTVSLLQQLGYVAGVTTQQSTWQFEGRPLELRRIRVRGAWSLADFSSAMEYWTQGMY